MTDEDEDAQAREDEAKAREQLRRTLADDSDLVDMDADDLRKVALTTKREGRRLWARLLLGVLLRDENARARRESRARALAGLPKDTLA
jgi:hypothetical protein